MINTVNQLTGFYLARIFAEMKFGTGCKIIQSLRKIPKYTMIKRV